MMVTEVINSEGAEQSILLTHSYGKISDERRDSVLADIYTKRETASKRIIEIDIKLDGIVKALATEEILTEFGKRFQMGLDNLSFEQKHYLIELYIENIELHWGSRGGIQLVINLWFDQKK